MVAATADCGKNHKHNPECWCGVRNTFQILTKRPARMLKEYFNVALAMPPLNRKARYVQAHDAEYGLALPNIWLGVSVEDQKTADERIPLLLQTPAAVRWVSYEPALGSVNLNRVPHFEMGRPSSCASFGVWIAFL